jgi:hypothetical protein
MSSPKGTASPKLSTVEEKTVEVVERPTSSAAGRRIHEFEETEGYVVDVEAGSADGQVKLAKDGRTRLIPEPSDDPNDPLNWTWSRKHLILFIISLAAFLPDYGSATGAVTQLVQAQYVATPNQSNGDIYPALYPETDLLAENGT